MTILPFTEIFSNMVLFQTTDLFNSLNTSVHVCCFDTTLFYNNLLIITAAGTEGEQPPHFFAPPPKKKKKKKTVDLPKFETICAPHLLISSDGPDYNH